MIQVTSTLRLLNKGSFYNWGGGPDYSSALKVWSTEGKYLVSQAGEKLKIINTENCSVSIVSDEEFNFASWMPM